MSERIHQEGQKERKENTKESVLEIRGEEKLEERKELEKRKTVLLMRGKRQKRW